MLKLDGVSFFMSLEVAPTTKSGDNMYAYILPGCFQIKLTYCNNFGLMSRTWGFVVCITQVNPWVQRPFWVSRLDSPLGCLSKPSKHDAKHQSCSSHIHHKEMLFEERNVVVMFVRLWDLYKLQKIKYEMRFVLFSGYTFWDIVVLHFKDF